jgi:hypothetical protein
MFGPVRFRVHFGYVAPDLELFIRSQKKERTTSSVQKSLTLSQDFNKLLDVLYVIFLFLTRVDPT